MKNSSRIPALLLAPLLLAATWTAAQPAPDRFTLKAFLPFWKSAVVRLKINDRLVHTDTLRQDVYSYTGAIGTAVPGMLELTQGRSTVFVPLFIEPGTIRVRDRGNRRLEAVGTASNDAYAAVNRRLDSLAKTCNAAGSGAIMDCKKKGAAAYIRAYPQSPVSLQLLYDHYYLNNAVADTAYFRLFNALDRPLQATGLGRKISAETAVSQVTATGTAGVNMGLPDTAGSLRPLFAPGQVTLIQFWGSWCLPCRREHPALKRIFQRYSHLGFTITGVSLDTRPVLWKAAIRQDGLPWRQLADGRGWQGAPVSVFGVKTIPANVLVDKNGIVLGRNLTPEGLEKLLSGLLDAKVF